MHALERLSVMFDDLSIKVCSYSWIMVTFSLMCMRDLVAELSHPLFAEMVSLTSYKLISATSIHSLSVVDI